MEEIKTIYQLMQKVPTIRRALYSAAVNHAKGHKDDYYTYIFQACAAFEATEDLKRKGYLNFKFDFYEIDNQLARLSDVMEEKKIRNDIYPF